MKNTATLLFCTFLVLGAMWVSAKVIDANRTWDDTEYEINQQCAFLKGVELDKCKINFNLK